MAFIVLFSFAPKKADAQNVKPFKGKESGFCFGPSMLFGKTNKNKSETAGRLETIYYVNAKSKGKFDIDWGLAGRVGFGSRSEFSSFTCPDGSFGEGYTDGMYIEFVPMAALQFGFGKIIAIDISTGAGIRRFISNTKEIGKAGNRNQLSIPVDLKFIINPKSSEVPALFIGLSTNVGMAIDGKKDNSSITYSGHNLFVWGICGGLYFR
ncbi:MAG: hypothetical protein FWE50_01420 [Alphaproteobacteria bacterium]|nr:hypothetical protein [Alphaproteobacteria bacterium]